MKKLKLDVGDLRVEAFEAVVERPAGGTVAAQELTQATCHQFTCNHPTCMPLCDTGEIC